MKTFLDIAAAAMSLLGVVVGVWGTYLLTRWTHPYGWWGFNWSILVMFGRKLIGQDNKNKRIHSVAVVLSRMKDENKAESLQGLYWVFFGFTLQTVGAVFAMASAIIGTHWAVRDSYHSDFA